MTVSTTAPLKSHSSRDKVFDVVNVHVRSTLVPNWTLTGEFERDDIVVAVGEEDTIYLHTHTQI